MTLPSLLNLINISDEIFQASFSIGLTGVMARSVSNLVVILAISSATASSIFCLREASAVGLELIARACWRVISSGSMSGGSSSKGSGRNWDCVLVEPVGMGIDCRYCRAFDIASCFIAALRVTAVRPWLDVSVARAKTRRALRTWVAGRRVDDRVLPFDARGTLVCGWLVCCWVGAGGSWWVGRMWVVGVGLRSAAISVWVGRMGGGDLGRLRCPFGWGGWGWGVRD